MCLFIKHKKIRDESDPQLIAFGSEVRDSLACFEKPRSNMADKNVTQLFKFLN